MKFFDKLDWPVMFISFCVGLAFVYVFQKEQLVTVVWPSPSRAPVTAYETPDGKCYGYEAKKVSCKQ